MSNGSVATVPAPVRGEVERKIGGTRRGSRGRKAGLAHSVSAPPIREYNTYIIGTISEDRQGEQEEEEEEWADAESGPDDGN